MGGGNVFSQMKDLYKLQREAKDMQKKLREQKVTGESSDKKIKIFMNGAQEFEDLYIDETLLEEGNSELIRKEFREAFKDYQKKLQKEIASSFDIGDLRKALGN